LNFGWVAEFASWSERRFQFAGELVNEDETILGGKESAGLPQQGHYSEKDGILARLLAAEEEAGRRAILSKTLTDLKKRATRPRPVC
jgi:hypothetical protein